MKKIIGLALLIFVLFFFLKQSAHSLPSSNTQECEQFIKASGNFEVDTIGLSFKTAGRLIERVFREGDVIIAGEQVGRLDDVELVEEVGLKEAEVEIARASLAELEAGYRHEDIAQAEAVVQRLQAQLSELRAGTRIEEISAIKAQVANAQTDAEKAANEFKRQLLLHERKVISVREFEIAKANRDGTLAKLAEVESRLKLAQEGPREQQITAASFALAESQNRLALLRNGSRPETIAQGRGRLHLAERALALAKIRLANSVLQSPISGRVLTHNVHPGEYVNPGTPIVTVADLNTIWLRAYINETELGLVKIGQMVSVFTDSFEKKEFKGKVSFISSEAEFTPKAIQTTKERVKLMYRIKVDVENPKQELKPGMPGDAVIRLTDAH